MTDKSFFTPLGPVPPPPITRPARQRTKTSKAKAGSLLDDDSGTRSLKLKISSNAGQSDAMDPTSVGWDRELDSDTEDPLILEEHLILRVPPGGKLKKILKEMTEKKETPPADLWFKFKDSRRAVVGAGGKLYGAKLVDLPTLLETQKLTGQGGQVVKVADISQMLLVEEEVKDESEVTRHDFHIEDFIYPHGITPPLKHVRKRRFRKRVNRRTIEAVEKGVEALLEQDSRAEEVRYEMVDGDFSDDEFGSQNGEEQPVAGPSGSRNDVPMRDATDATPAADDFEDEEEFAEEDGLPEGEEEEEDEDDDGIDSDLEREIEANLGKAAAAEVDASGSEDGSLFGDDDDDDEDGGAAGDANGDTQKEEEEEEKDSDEEEEEEDESIIEDKRRIKNLAEGVHDVEKLLAKKQAEIDAAPVQPNPILRKRNDDLIKRLTTELESKKSVHAAAVRDLERKKARNQDAADQALAASTSAAATSTSAGAGASTGSARPPSVSAEQSGAPKPDKGKGKEKEIELEMEVEKPVETIQEEGDFDVDVDVDVQIEDEEVDVMMDEP